MFIIKNVSPILDFTVLGTSVPAQTNLDLQTVATNATIISSLMSGELFDKIVGRMISVVNPTHFANLGATDAQMNYWHHCGFLQGLGKDFHFTYPFQFTSDGYLKTETEVTISGLAVDVRGDAPVGSRDSVLVMGTEDGTSAGTVHTLRFTSDGYAQVDVQGFTPDHATASENPVLGGGKYVTDPTLLPLDANDKGYLLMDILRNLSVTLGTKLAGEDLNLDVMNTLAGCTYVSITTNTTTVIKSGAGALLGILFTTPGSVDNTVIFYDNTAASGTVLIPSIPTDVAFTPKLLPLGGIYFNTGLTAITATGTASTFVVFYR